MEQRTIYTATLTGTHETEADNTQDAIDKTVAYFAAHLDELEYQVTQREVWIEVPEV